MTMLAHGTEMTVGDEWDAWAPARCLTAAVHGFAPPMNPEPTADATDENRSAPVVKRGTLTGATVDAATGADVLAHRARIGRKFEPSDITPDLVAFAAAWARDYVATGAWCDSFMADMSKAARRTRPLSAGMVKGILNTYCAVNRDAAPAAPAAAVEPVHLGAYYGSDGIAYVVQAAKDSGNLYGKRWNGKAFEYCRGAMPTIRAGRAMTLEEATAFGKLAGSCCCCGRRLTKPSSIAAGIGPVCASRF